VEELAHRGAPLHELLGVVELLGVRLERVPLGDHQVPARVLDAAGQLGRPAAGAAEDVLDRVARGGDEGISAAGPHVDLGAREDHQTIVSRRQPATYAGPAVVLPANVCCTPASPAQRHSECVKRIQQFGVTVGGTRRGWWSRGVTLAAWAGF